jgi:solute carrier family 25 protein 33/36
VEEGWKALYKGLGPSLVGIIPARSVEFLLLADATIPRRLTIRAINFYCYPTAKVYLASKFPNAPVEKVGQTAEDSPLVHLGAAVIAGKLLNDVWVGAKLMTGIATATGTNPIWGELMFTIL